jgi:putative phosphoribosyl transferase
VIFAHGSGSSRLSSRNRQIAESLDRRGFATLLLDLLTAREEAVDVRTMEYRFDIERLGTRVTARWKRSSGSPATGSLVTCGPCPEID